MGSPILECVLRRGRGCWGAGGGHFLGVLTELDEQLAITPALVGGQCQDARHVVILCRFFLLQNPPDICEPPPDPPNSHSHTRPPRPPRSPPQTLLPPPRSPQDPPAPIPTPQALPSPPHTAFPHPKPHSKPSPDPILTPQAPFYTPPKPHFPLPPPLQIKPDLGEIANDVEALAVVLSHDIEEERIGVVVKCFVVQEALGQQAQVL